MGRKRYTHFLRDMRLFLSINSWWVCCYQSPNLCRTVHSSSPVRTAKRFSSHLPSPHLTSFSQVEVQGICFPWGLGGWACCTLGNWLINAEAVEETQASHATIPGVIRGLVWRSCKRIAGSLSVQLGVYWLEPCPGEVAAVPGGAFHIQKYFLAKQRPVMIGAGPGRSHGPFLIPPAYPSSIFQNIRKVTWELGRGNGKKGERGIQDVKEIKENSPPGGCLSWLLALPEIL